MAVNEYHFITHWRVHGTVEEVADVLDNPLDLPRWWPEVYLEVREVEPADGARRPLIRLHTKGRLPYTLHWTLRVTESRYPHGFTLQAWGDLEGRGVWQLEQRGEFVDVTYDWRVSAGNFRTFVGEHGIFGGEAVAQSVEADSGAPFGSSGAGAVLSFAAIGFDLS